MAAEPDTWFLVIQCTPQLGGKWFVARADREKLPKVTVVSAGHDTEAEAEAIAALMRETGTA